jgi:hypothetical protein
MLSVACSKAPSNAHKIAQEPPVAHQAAEPSKAEATRADPLPEPIREGRAEVGWIEMTLGDERLRLAGPCRHDGRSAKQPYLEVLDPNTASPRVILDACGSNGVYFDIVGNALKLPGDVTPKRLRILDVQTGEEWEATGVEFRVTEFGAPGAPVAGTFRGTMSARLNRDPVPIRGSFRVLRAPDRYAP